MKQRTAVLAVALLSLARMGAASEAERIVDFQSRAWAEKFAAVLTAAGKADGALYQPLWYDGNSWQRVGTAGFVGSLGSSLSGAISSSSTAPGSSSGSSGGSSGGGGGGGGGGGW